MTDAIVSDDPGLARVPGDWAPRDEAGLDWPEAFRDDRRRARAVAVQVLYEVDLTRRDPITVFERRIVDDATPGASVPLARAMVTGVVARLTEIDRALTDGAPHWPVARIDPVERAVLRIATYELLHGRAEGDRVSDRVPQRVAINEAVELARLFGTEVSVRFVNGVLGAVVRQLLPDAPTELNVTDPDTAPTESDTKAAHAKQPRPRSDEPSAVHSQPLDDRTCRLESEAISPSGPDAPGRLI
jgi:N utilization substance protein B